MIPRTGAVWPAPNARAPRVPRAPLGQQPFPVTHISASVQRHEQESHLARRYLCFRGCCPTPRGVAGHLRTSFCRRLPLGHWGGTQGPTSGDAHQGLHPGAQGRRPVMRRWLPLSQPAHLTHTAQAAQLLTLLRTLRHLLCTSDTGREQEAAPLLLPPSPLPSCLLHPSGSGPFRQHSAQVMKALLSAGPRGLCVCAHARKHVHTKAHIHTKTYLHLNTHSQRYTKTYTYAHSHMHSCTHIYTDAQVNTSAYSHIHMHT